MKSQLLFKTAFSFLIIFSFLVNAQVKITGKVNFKNKGTKDISVTLKGTYDGTTTDENGNYSFGTTEKGNQTLVFSSPKFIVIENPILIENQPIAINIDLKEQISEIDAVVISAGTIEASDKKRATASLKPLDIYTTPGADAQVSTGYKFLPGVQNAGESEGLFVRGGTGAETKFFIDGNLVNNYFSSSVPGLAGRDRFNTSIFKGSSFSSGGYSALFGQALSSVLLLESVDLPDKSSYGMSVFPFSLSGDFQKLNGSKTASYGIQMSYSNLHPITKFLNFDTHFIDAPKSFSGNFNFRFKTKSGGFLKYYGSLDTNSLAVSQPSLELNYDETQPKIKGNNTFHSLNFKQKFGKNVLTLGSSFSINKTDYAIQIVNANAKIGEINVHSKGIYFNNKAVLERKIARISNIKIGAELQSANDKSISGSSFENAENNAKINNVTAAFFVETNLVFNKNFSSSFGLRTEKSSFLNQWNFAPRFSTAYRISDNWVTSFAYGIFYQTPETKNLTTAFLQNFQKATHYILQFQRTENDRTFRVETYYKNYQNLAKTNTSNFETTVQNSYGNGFAKGLEVLWRDKKTFKNIDYWVSYSYLDSKREYENYPTELYPSFAAKHNISLVAKKFVLKWKTGFNCSYTYTSGRPFYDIVANNGENILLQQGKVKDFSRLNFSVNYLPNLGRKEAKSFTIIVAGINNVLGTKNIYGYRFSEDGLRSAAVLPASKIFAFIGVIFNFGIDKTDEAINNSL